VRKESARACDILIYFSETTVGFAIYSTVQRETEVASEAMEKQQQ